MNIEKYKSYKNKLSSFNNRIERRIINKNITTDELYYFEELDKTLAMALDGYTPEYSEGECDDEIFENFDIESEIFEQMKKIGIAYFLTLTINDPISFLKRMSFLAEELKKVTIYDNKTFMYNGVSFDIHYDENSLAMGTYLDDCIIINPKKTKEANEETIITILHEITHCVLAKNGLQKKYLMKLGIKNIEELVCEVVAKNCRDLFYICDAYEEY